MPRRRKPGRLSSEDNVAERVRIERERRGWSTAELAERVTDAGCPINQSAIWRIESGSPRRKISVNELIAFAAVFDLEPEAMLLPADQESDLAMTYDVVASWVEAVGELTMAKSDYEYWLNVLVTEIWGDEKLQAAVPDLLRRALAADEGGFHPKAYDTIFPDFAARLQEAKDKGAPPMAPTALEILTKARERGRDMEWVRARAAHWGCTEDLNTILKTGKVWVPTIVGGKPQEMPLDEYLNAVNSPTDEEPSVDPKHPARWTDDKHVGEVQP